MTKGYQNQLPPKVILLGWVSFFADISSEMIYPLMPLFLVTVIKGPALTLGLIEGFAQVIVSCMAALSGFKSDKSGKRIPFLRWGYGLPILGKAIISIATTWHAVLIGRSIDRFGKGLRGSPRDALIADAVGFEQRGKAFGFHRMMDTAGAMIGVLLAAGLLWILKDQSSEFIYRMAIGLAAILAFCSFVVTFFVDEEEVTKKESKIQNKLEEKEKLISVLKTLGRDYWITLGILTLFALANSSDAFLLLRANDIGLSPLQVVLAYAIYNFGYSVLSYPAGVLSDHFGRWKVLTAGWILYAFVYAGFALCGSTLVWFLFAVYGIYMAFTDGVSKALIVDSVPTDKKGTALGFLYFAVGMSALSSNLLAGYLWDNYSKATPFWFGAITALIVVVVVVVFISGKFSKKSL